MPDRQRIEDLRRRVQADPTSIAFAQLAEELRRAGAFQESVETCRAGLAIHPSYLSARVTFGRALLELGQLDDAQSELSLVLAHAPENLSALRGLGEICNRRGQIDQALDHYRAALVLAPNDPDLEVTVSALTHAIERAASQLEPARPEPRPPEAEPVLNAPADATPRQPIAWPTFRPTDAPSAVSFVAEPSGWARDRGQRTVAALETWLDAINVARARRRA